MSGVCKRTGWTRVASLALACGCLAIATSPATAANRVVKIGDPCPQFSELPGVDGEAYGSDVFENKKAVAIIFTSNECPVARAYEDRLKSIVKDFSSEPFTLLAVNVNDGESLDDMKQHAAENEFSFPYIRDESKELAKRLGATCTPHAFLFDGSGEIVYMGAIDSTWQGETDETDAYLRDAIQATLSGETPPVTDTKQAGCSIRW